MSAVSRAIAMTRRDGYPLATVTWESGEDVTLTNHDALQFAKSLVWNGYEGVEMVTESGRLLDAEMIGKAVY